MTMPVVDEFDNIYCIDTMLNNEKDSICSYIIDSEKACIVDCGPTAAEGAILDTLDELEIKGDKVEYIAITHIHLDHGGGAGKLLRHFPNAKVLVHPKGFEHLINPLKLWEAAKNALGEVADIYKAPEPCDKSRIIVVEDNQAFDLGNYKIRTIYTPGHAAHHIAFYIEELSMLFPGDSAGMYYMGSIVPTTPPPFNFEKALKSLEKLIALNPETIAFTHFGFAKNCELLRRVHSKTVEWIEMAKEVIESGGGIEELYKKIAEEDKDFEKLVELFKNSKITSKSYILGIYGLVDYVKRINR